MLFDVVGTRLNNTDKTKMLNVVRTILFGITLPEMPQTCCKLWTFSKLTFSDLLQVVQTTCSKSAITTCSKSDFRKLHQA